MEAKKTPKANLENKKGLFVQVGFVVTLLALLVAFNWKTYERNDFEEQVRKGGTEIVETIIPTTELLPPEPPKVEIQMSTDAVEIRDDNNVEGPELANVNAEDTGGPVVTDLPRPQPIIEEPEEVDDTPFQIVQNMPEFKGGYGELQNYLAANLIYPQLAKETGIQGKVYITFIVEKDGSISNARVIRDIGGGCGAEALRVIQSMPKWESGKERGKPVRVEINLPISFTLQ